MRALHLPNDAHIIKELQTIGVDPNAHDIFIKKARCSILKINALSCAQANVLKQTALVCGADAAIPKTAYFGGKKRKVAVLLFANQRELMKIRDRLIEQDWLSPLADEIDMHLHQTGALFVRARRRRIILNRTYIMGIVNATPDSFYNGSRYCDEGTVCRVVELMEKAGVDIIDVGAESSRPGAAPISARVEIKRLKNILPVIRRNTGILLSVDTHKAEVAAYAIDNGASFINDISALRFDPKMASLIARSKVGVVLMHMKGTPRTMQRNPHYKDCMGEIHDFFKERIAFARENGIDPGQIMIDPGLGFGKRLTDNYEIINRLSELKAHNRPICVGHSRKSFIGYPEKLPPDECLEGTIGTQALLISNGANILRVHDVGEAKKVAVLIDTILL
ncbi:dihydropteroate synthase [candidate division WOR-3 bacterium]|nr:dihydropteroate synthase [candidate division WOR-3 bacterium]